MTVYFRVRNWSKFQHYKDRAPPWIKLHREILSSRTWVMLDDKSKALAIACMLLASDTDNKVPADPVYLQRVAYLQELPNLAPLVETDFIELIDESGNPLADASKAIANRTDCSPEERREEQRREDIRPSAVVADATPAPKKHTNGTLHTAVVAAYHEILPELPGVKTWPDRRRRKLDARIAERLKHGKPADTVEYWQSLFRKVAASDFLCGRSKADWRCPGLEWLLEPKNFERLIEGSYDNHHHGGNDGRSHAFARSAAVS